MSPRIEPTLEPASTQTLRVDPAHRVGRPPFPQPSAPPSRGPSVLSWIFGLLLACIVLALAAIVALRWLPPPISSYMLQSPTKPVQYLWVPSANIADTARRAVVAAEDQKFWTHQGFDLDAIHKAQQYNQDARHHRRGASTISQQTAKNLFLWPGGYVRKGIEAGLTVLIEKIWGKDRILEMYLNIAEFGPGIYGVEAASRNYFGKPASALTAEEAARLAAVLPNPRHWSVRAPGAYVQTRVAWILGQMGYGARDAPQEEPLPPPSESPGIDDDDSGDAAALTAPGVPQPQLAPVESPAVPAAAPAASEPPAPVPAPDAPSPGTDAAPDPAAPAAPAAVPAEAPPPADKPPG
jgi:monofunctional glycosyltransferase